MLFNKQAMIYAATGIGLLASAIRLKRKTDERLHHTPCAPCMDETSRHVASDVQKFLELYPDTTLTKDELTHRFYKERYGIDSMWEVPKFFHEPTFDK